MHTGSIKDTASLEQMQEMKMPPVKGRHGDSPFVALLVPRTVYERCNDFSTGVWIDCGIFLSKYVSDSVTAPAGSEEALRCNS
jgi:hypothetical protein